MARTTKLPLGCSFLPLVALAVFAGIAGSEFVARLQPGPPPGGYQLPRKIPGKVWDAHAAELLERAENTVRTAKTLRATISTDSFWHDKQGGEHEAHYDTEILAARPNLLRRTTSFRQKVGAKTTSGTAYDFADGWLRWMGGPNHYNVYWYRGDGRDLWVTLPFDGFFPTMDGSTSADWFRKQVVAKTWPRTLIYLGVRRLADGTRCEVVHQGYRTVYIAEDGAVRRIEFQSDGPNAMRYTLNVSKLILNESVSRSEFEFVPPDHARPPSNLDQRLAVEVDALLRGWN